MRRPRLVAPLVVALIAMAGPAAAQATTVGKVNGGTTISVFAGSGQLNDINVAVSGSNYRVTDTAGATPVDASCSPVDPNTVDCPAAGVTNVQADLGDQNDKFVLDAGITSLIFGRAGNDTITGGPVTDDLNGGDDDDTIDGRDGNDSLAGEEAPGDAGTGANNVSGGAGDDSVNGASGPDTLDGGPGADTVSGFGDNDTVAGGGENDTLSGGDGNDTLRGDAGNDTLGSLDRIGAAKTSVERGDDSLEGGEGDDTLRAGFGPDGSVPDDDRLNGGPGADTATWEQRDAAVSVTMAGGADDGGAGERDDVGGDVENVVGGNADDTLVGSDRADGIDGGRGSDVVRGAAGADTLDGGAADAGSDELDGGDGPDRLTGNAGNDVLDGGGDGDTVAGGGDADTLRGGDGDDAMTGGPGSDDEDGQTGNDVVDGSAAGPVGDDGGDVLKGGAGDDQVLGGDGDDRVDGGDGSDSMDGGAGTDTAVYDIATGTVEVTLDNDRDDGRPGERDLVEQTVENVDGGGAQDTLTGSAGQNGLNGGAGEDYADGSGGADVLEGGDDVDVLRARDGTANARVNAAGAAVVDDVRCGRGFDLAIVDTRDRVDKASCELVASRATRPRQGRDVQLAPVGAGNQFGLAGGTRTVPLQDRLTLPIARSGRTGRSQLFVAGTSRGVRLTTGKGTRSTQTGRFYQGDFTVVQGRHSPVTELRLPNLSKAECAPGAKVSPARRRRRLWGNAHGRYRTRTRHSTAAVRGTTWLTEERCNGTLTVVRRGTVVVRDLAKHKTVVVRAGHRYFARGRRP